MLQRLKRIYPFNLEQTVNILSEFGPLVTMFVVNAAAGINAGTWALLITTVIAMGAMRAVLGRLPVFPLIASSVTVFFGILTLITNDPMWVQIKVTIFNALFAGVLYGGLFADRGVASRWSIWSVAVLTAAGLAGQFGYLAWIGKADSIEEVVRAASVSTAMICIGGVLIGFLFGAAVLRKNFFGYVFEKTFHYTQEGWDRFTFSFAWFFMFTAVANEGVRLAFPTDETFNLLGRDVDGVSIWILFKILVIMPLTGIYAWYLTRLMQKHRLPDPEPDPAHGSSKEGAPHAGGAFRKDAAEFSVVPHALRSQSATMVRSPAAE